MDCPCCWLQLWFSYSLSFIFILCFYLLRHWQTKIYEVLFVTCLHSKHKQGVSWIVGSDSKWEEGILGGQLCNGCDKSVAVSWVLVFPVFIFLHITMMIWQVPVVFFTFVQWIYCFLCCHDMLKSQVTIHWISDPFHSGHWIRFLLEEIKPLIWIFKNANYHTL